MGTSREDVWRLQCQSSRAYSATSKLLKFASLSRNTKAGSDKNAGNEDGREAEAGRTRGMKEAGGGGGATLKVSWTGRGGRKIRGTLAEGG